jgi:hypothetical protein
LPVDLHKRTGQLFRLPRRGRLAGAQPDRHILDPHCLARPEREVADDAIALVQQAQHGDPLGHRRDAGLFGRRARHIDCDRLVFSSLIAGAATARGRQQGKRKEGGGTGHAYSGFHAS